MKITLNHTITKMMHDKVMITVCCACNDIFINNEWHSDYNHNKVKLQQKNKEAIYQHLSHGICTNCLSEHYPDIYQKHYGYK